MKNVIKKAVTLLLIIIMTTLTFTGCEEKSKVVMGRLDRSKVEMSANDYYWEMRSKSRAGNPHKNVEIKSFRSLNSMLLELNFDMVDYISISESTGEYLAEKDSSFATTSTSMDIEYMMGTRVNDRTLCNEISAAIAELKADGTLASLIKEYITDLNGDPTPNKIIGNPDGKTHVVGITGDLPPFDFVSANGTPAGFNVALINAISHITGCNYEVVQFESGARMTALASEKIDIVFWMGFAVAEGFEPKQDEVLLTESYFSEPVALVTKSFPIEKVKTIYGLK